MIRRSPSLNSAVFPTYCSAMLPCLLGLSLFPRTQTFLGCPVPTVIREIGIHRHLYSTIVSMQPAASVGPTSINDMPSGHPREGVKARDQAILLVSVPIFSIQILTTSPALRNSPRAEPTPAGVPVRIRSPGGSVIPLDNRSICSARLKIMSLLCESC